MNGKDWFGENRYITSTKTNCCWRLSWREHRVSQPGNGHLWFLSPVWTLEWRARWPLVVKARSQVLQTCFFLGVDVVAGAEDEDVECDVDDSCGEEEGDSDR